MRGRHDMGGDHTDTGAIFCDRPMENFLSRGRRQRDDACGLHDHAASFASSTSMMKLLFQWREDQRRGDGGTSDNVFYWESGIQDHISVLTIEKRFSTDFLLFAAARTAPL